MHQVRNSSNAEQNGKNGEESAEIISMKNN